MLCSLRRPGRRAAPRRSYGLAAAVVTCLGLLFGCAGTPPKPVGPTPAQAKATIARLLPAGVTDRTGWSTDIYAAFAVQEIDPSVENICATVAILEQESGFEVDPVVPNLPKTAWAEIDRRAEHAGVPALVVHAALQIHSSDGRSYAERIDGVRTEKQLSDIFEDLIGRVPLGNRLFGGLNPIRTRGPMQVNVAFVARYAGPPYPYPARDGIDEELFTRRGSVFFGIAHLLRYRAPYDRMLYRFADYNAGQYASRNAAFQKALTSVSGVPLVADGALIAHADDQQSGSTELAARVIARRLGFDDGDVRRALERQRSSDFEQTKLYDQVFALADRENGRPLPRAVVPDIDLQGPKITRHLTTAWYAGRVEGRYRRCVER